MLLGMMLCTECVNEEVPMEIHSIMFLGDTGAQMHCLTTKPGGMDNVKKIKSGAKLGNEIKMKIDTKGDLQMKSNVGIGRVLKDVHVVPG